MYHNGDTEGKGTRNRIYRRKVLAPFKKLKKEGFEFRLLFLSDHKTLTSTRGHDGGPVPYILYDSRIKKAQVFPIARQTASRGLP